MIHRARDAHHSGEVVNRVDAQSLGAKKLMQSPQQRARFHAVVVVSEHPELVKEPPRLDVMAGAHVQARRALEPRARRDSFTQPLPC